MPSIKIRISASGFASRFFNRIRNRIREFFNVIVKFFNPCAEAKKQQDAQKQKDSLKQEDLPPSPPSALNQANNILIEKEELIKFKKKAIISEKKYVPAIENALDILAKQKLLIQKKSFSDLFKELDQKKLLTQAILNYMKAMTVEEYFPVMEGLIKLDEQGHLQNITPDRLYAQVAQLITTLKEKKSGMSRCVSDSFLCRMFKTGETFVWLSNKSKKQINFDTVSDMSSKSESTTAYTLKFFR